MQTHDGSGPSRRRSMLDAAGAGLTFLLGLLTLVLILAAANARGATSTPPPEAGSDAAPLAAALLFRADGERLVTAPALKTEVMFTANALAARVKVRQTFRNDTTAWLEGVYVFPLPEDSAVDRLRMTIGGRTVEGEIREREEAREAYEQAAAAGQRASLVEQERPNIFTTSVANVGSGDEIAVEIEFQQKVLYRDGRFSLRFPMVVAPRYMPGEPYAASVSTVGWSPDTEAVPDASRITPPVAHPSAGPLNPVILAVNLDPGLPLAEVRSPSHEVTAAEDGNGRWRVELVATMAPADRDFVLEWTPAAGKEPRAALFAETLEEETYLLGMIVPPAAEPIAPTPRDVTFVIDTSGSMAGNSIAQAKAALGLALDRLTPEDRFNVIRFSDRTTRLYPRLHQADADGLRRARRFVDGLEADGGTEMLEALEAALDQPTAEGRLAQIVFLTDGAVGNELQLFETIAARLGSRRLFTIGIGSAPNGYFMRKAAEIGRGIFTYIGSEAEVASRLDALFRKLENPVLTDIAIAWPEGTSIVVLHPDPIPDLYAGEPVAFVAKLAGVPVKGKIVASGKAGGQPWRQALPLAAARSTDDIAQLWGRAEIEAEMDRLPLGDDPELVRAEVLAIALRHQLLSQYTSLVAIDPEPARPAGVALASAALPVNLPAGWRYEKVFGDPGLTRMLKARLHMDEAEAATLALPQTATPAPLHLMIGLLLLSAAGAILMLGRRYPVRA